MKYIANIFRGRLNSFNFVLGFFVYGFFVICASLVSQLIGPNVNWVVAEIIILFPFILALVFGYSLGVRRFHDFGWSGWNYLLMLVPFLNIYIFFSLIFRNGQKSDNKYGSEDRGNRLRSILGLRD